MTLTELYEKYFLILYQMFLFDIEVFSKPWLYAWLIPVFIYLSFFIVKWAVLTIPVWLPFFIAFSPFLIIAEKVKK